MATRRDAAPRCDSATELLLVQAVASPAKAAPSNAVRPTNARREDDDGAMQSRVSFVRIVSNEVAISPAFSLAFWPRGTRRLSEILAKVVGDCAGFTSQNGLQNQSVASGQTKFVVIGQHP